MSQRKRKKLRAAIGALLFAQWSTSRVRTLRNGETVRVGDPRVMKEALDMADRFIDVLDALDECDDGVAGSDNCPDCEDEGIVYRHEGTHTCHCQAGKAAARKMRGDG